MWPAATALGKGAHPLCNPEGSVAVVADTVAKLRIDDARKSRWQATAEARGRTLSGFMRLACDAAAEGFDTASIRADLTRVRRFVNLTGEIARSLDRTRAERLEGEAAEILRIIERHLAIGGRS